MSLKQKIGRWHWGQLIIAITLLGFFSLASLVLGSGAWDQRQQEMEPCRVVTAKESETEEEQMRRIRNTVARRINNQRTGIDCDDVLPAAVPAGLLVTGGAGGVLTITILWIWFGARRPEDSA